MSATTAGWLVLLCPIVGTILIAVGYARWPGRTAGWLATLAIGLSFVFSVIALVKLLGLSPDHRQLTSTLWNYDFSAGVDAKLQILVDPLSVFMIVVVSGVSALIHLYSVTYMNLDRGFSRYFSYLNYFVLSMLLLVLAGNFLMLIIGWAFVGAASYLLISFWYRRTTATRAGIKAFVINVVGDVGLVIATFILFQHTGTVQFLGVFHAVPHSFAHNSTPIVLAGLLLLVGAFAKSAQVPLQAWLPDAMEGPTPVSALIHAATMVTAGVYLIARSHAIFDASEPARIVVMCVGALTLLIGCIIGCALGLIHLLAHGFFKAGLFLGAGSVMHGMNDQTDIRRFGGLRKYMPITWATTGLGFLAIIGIPPLSGFFTKEPIIGAAYHYGGWLGPVLGTAALLGSGLTAFYMTRLFVLTFHGPKRWTEDIEHPHESKPIMTVPLVLLAVGSVAAGFLLSRSVVEWLTPTFGEMHEDSELWLITGLTILATLTGAGLAIALFRNGTELVEQPAGPIVTAAGRNLYGDTFNEAVFEAPGRYLTRALVYLDGRGVDGLVNGLAAAVGGGSGRLRRAQTGFVRSYALSILGGALLVVAAMLAVTYG